MSMQEALATLVEVAAELAGNELVRAGVLTLAGYVREINLPETDDRWRRVLEMLREAITDIHAAGKLDDATAAMRARLTAEHQMHRQLREFGLIEVG